MSATVRKHWPEYLMEAAGLAIFMIAAALFGSLLEHPASPVRQALPNATLRRAVMGIAMGATAIAIIHSAWGKQSGAHLNPSVTLAFMRLGKMAPVDALFYVVAQFAGGVCGVSIAAVLMPGALAHPSVNYVATLPGSHGVWVAFTAELAISFALMLVVLRASSTPRLERFTGWIAGVLVALWIAIEAPLSGMSMNPARTFGSAVFAMEWRGLWIYFTAPLLGMLAAAEFHRAWSSGELKHCAKLHHHNTKRCIFCGADDTRTPVAPRTLAVLRPRTRP